MGDIIEGCPKAIGMIVQVTDPSVTFLVLSFPVGMGLADFVKKAVTLINTGIQSAYVVVFVRTGVARPMVVIERTQFISGLFQTTAGKYRDTPIRVAASSPILDSQALTQTWEVTGNRMYRNNRLWLWWVDTGI